MSEKLREVEEAARIGFIKRTTEGGICLKADGSLNIGPRPGVRPKQRPITIIEPHDEDMGDHDDYDYLFK
jgi:hypothetical protein